MHARELARYRRYKSDSCGNYPQLARRRAALYLRDHPLHDAGADAQRAADLENAHALGAEAAYALLDRGRRAGTAERRPFLPGARKPGVDPFANDAAFELSE